MTITPFSPALPGATLALGAALPAAVAGLASGEPIAIDAIRIGSLDGRLEHPFVIASDATKQTDVENVRVVVRTVDGNLGVGEAAPYKGIAGDTALAIRNDLTLAIPNIWGRDMTPVKFFSTVNRYLKWPAARAALETAYLDAQARTQGISLLTYLNPEAKKRPLMTDITIPITGVAYAFELARKYRNEGFTRIKVKVGDTVSDAVGRVGAVIAAFDEVRAGPRLELLLDANEGYSSEKAILLLWHLENRLGRSPVIFEQPVERNDIDGMRHVRAVAEGYGTRIFADESVFTVEDARRVIGAEAADGINLKPMKHGGLIESLRIAELASEAGLELMIGGMVESRIAMTASLHLAQLIDTVWLDLDTPLLMEVFGVTGGMIYDGANIMLSDAKGLGVDTGEDL